MTKPKNAKTQAVPDEAPQQTVTKREQMLALLRREGGATLDEVVDLTGWLRTRAPCGSRA